jgi:hypothetical protein
MKNDRDDLRRRLSEILGRPKSVEPCLILQDMLERGELKCRLVDETGRRAWTCVSEPSGQTLDRIAGIENEVHRAMFELFVLGNIQFAADDLGRGLDIYWLAVPEYGERHQ